MPLNKVLKVNSDSELMSYIINVTPELASEIDLPVQGESIAPIGKLIMSNERFKNAFINTINLIGLTVIDRNYWEDPWEGFTERGTLNFGQSVPGGCIINCIWIVNACALYRRKCRPGWFWGRNRHWHR